MKTQQFLHLKKRLSLVLIGALLMMPVFAASDLNNLANNIGMPIVTSHQNDADHDGVIDSNDQCTSTEEGRFVKNNGCEYDTDADGIKNSMDRCPQTPLGLRVKGNGCL